MPPAVRPGEPMRSNAASRILEDLVGELRPLVDRFRNYKRSTAVLDFDDLIFSARDLLRDHEPVRRALAARYAHVLVDEFQDTDPLQTEIFWRLCGDPPAGQTDANGQLPSAARGAVPGRAIPSRPSIASGAPTFRAYVRAREAFRAQDSDRRPVDLHQLPILRLDPRLCERALREHCSRSQDSQASPRLDPFTPIATGRRAWRPSTSRWPRPRTNQRGRAARCRGGCCRRLCARLIGQPAGPGSRAGEQPALPAGRHRPAGSEWHRPVAL